MIEPTKKGLAALAIFALLQSTSAWSVETVVQTLDSVAVNSSGTVVEMLFSNPLRESDFEHNGIVGSAFATCTLTAIDGLFCLDGKLIRHWANPAVASSAETLINCEDPVLNLDTKKEDTCTGLAVDLSGTIWIAGKNKGKTHSLIEAIVIPDSGGCP